METRRLGLYASATVLAFAAMPGLLSPAHAEEHAKGGGVIAEQNSQLRSQTQQMGLPQLQLEAARLQARFVRASLDLEQARLNLRAARSAEVAAKAKAARAQRAADAESDALDAYLGMLYTEGPTMNSDLMLLLTGLDSADAMWKQNLVFEQVTTDQTSVVGRANSAQQVADQLHADAADLADEADEAQEQVQSVLDRISERADEVTEAAEGAFTDNAAAALFHDAQQTARNTAAKTEWRGYLTRLQNAAIKPPDAAALSNPAALPQGLEPLQGEGRASVPGVAVTPGATPLTVLPKQVVSAVDSGLDALGKPYVAGSSGPETYDCGGLVRAAYPSLDLGKTPAEQYEETRKVPASSIQVGDLAFFATTGAGIHHVGIYLGGGLMLAADGTASQVAVIPMPGKPYAVTRPSLASPGKPHTAPTGDGSQQMACGVELLAGGTTATGMTLPVAQGQFHYSARFGDPGGHWGSGFHTGLDFAAPVGTPIVAARAGTVSISHPDWAGNLVTIDHGNGLSTRYAHMSAVFVQPGQQVLAGQSIGAVGQLGNTTGPHLHFEVVILGTPVDPMLFLSGGKGTGNAGWGGFLNGMIPTSQLCPLKSAPGQLLRCDAARAYAAMSNAYRAEFGTQLCITDSYRSFASQVATFAKKPKLAAVPGTSNHGWALAVDLCGGIENVGSPQHTWLVQHGPAFGWVHPAWAEPGGGRPEPWHWEFGRIS